jgi:hypothetical protein
MLGVGRELRGILGNDGVNIFREKEIGMVKVQSVDTEMFVNYSVIGFVCERREKSSVRTTELRKSHT